jgi:hypothetical protein
VILGLARGERRAGGFPSGRIWDLDPETALPIGDFASRNEFFVAEIHNCDEGVILRIEQIPEVKDVAVIVDYVALRNPKLATHLNEKR